MENLDCESEKPAQREMRPMPVIDQMRDVFSPKPVHRERAQATVTQMLTAETRRLSNAEIGFTVRSARRATPYMTMLLIPTGELQTQNRPSV